MSGKLSFATFSEWVKAIVRLLWWECKAIIHLHHMERNTIIRHTRQMGFHSTKARPYRPQRQMVQSKALPFPLFPAHGNGPPALARSNPLPAADFQREHFRKTENPICVCITVVIHRTPGHRQAHLLSKVLGGVRQGFDVSIDCLGRCRTLLFDYFALSAMLSFATPVSWDLTP